MRPRASCRGGAPWSRTALAQPVCAPGAAGAGAAELPRARPGLQRTHSQAGSGCRCAPCAPDPQLSVLPPPATVHCGVHDAQTGDGRLLEEVQREEEAQGEMRGGRVTSSGGLSASDAGPGT